MIVRSSFEIYLKSVCELLYNMAGYMLNYSKGLEFAIEFFLIPWTTSSGAGIYSSFAPFRISIPETMPCVFTHVKINLIDNSKTDSLWRRRWLTVQREPNEKLNFLAKSYWTFKIWKTSKWPKKDEGEINLTMFDVADFRTLLFSILVVVSRNKWISEWRSQECLQFWVLSQYRVLCLNSFIIE